ncbi:MAG: L,D-transpeptidase family protein [Coriobacteriales bacterium]
MTHIKTVLSCVASAALALSLVPAAALTAYAEETGGTEAGTTAPVEGEGQPEEPSTPPVVVSDPAQAAPYLSFSCANSQGTWRSASKKPAAPQTTLTIVLSKYNVSGVKASLSLEGQELAPGVEYSCSISYGVYSSGTWTSASNGEAASAGQDVQALRFSLDEQSTAAQYYSLRYRVKQRDCGWLGWAQDGQSAGSYSSKWKISEVELKLVPRDAEPETSSVPAYLGKTSVSASYSLKNAAGSVKSASELGATAGKNSTSASSAIRIAASSSSADVPGSISYKVYQKGKGWSASAKQGSYAGSSSSKACITGIKMNRSSKLATFYDLYYRVYLKGYGWMGWAKNGALAGTTSYVDFPVTAYQLRLVPKGSAAPGKTANASSGKEGVLKEPAIAKRMQAKAKNLSSNTTYLLLTDTTYCRTAVFTGSKGNWTLKYLWKAGVGAWGSETPKGTYTTSSHVPVFGAEKGYNCWYGTCFDENREILFHSEVYNIGSKTQMQSGGLGTHVSHGCVRLALKNAKWIYENVPLGTKVLIF